MRMVRVCKNWGGEYVIASKASVACFRNSKGGLDRY